jgi:hypothetical protein
MQDYFIRKKNQNQTTGKEPSPFLVTSVFFCDLTLSFDFGKRFQRITAKRMFYFLGPQHHTAKMLSGVFVVVFGA